MTLYRQSLIRTNLERRARVVDGIRTFFNRSGFMEVETPVRIPAPAPEANIDAQEAGGWFLHTSPELCMKRLLAAGYEKIYQICRCFRKDERGGRHLPEMTLVEWYAAGWDYQDLMRQCEALIVSLTDLLATGPTLSLQGKTIDLSPPWDRLTVDDAFRRFAGISTDDALQNGSFDEVMGLEIEPRLGLSRPLFLYDYPAACGALARLNPDNPRVAERFELYIAGLELCNGFSELIDAVEQRRRFEEEQRLRNGAGKPVYPSPEPFLEALPKMPPAAGIALGLDRLVMLFCDATAIDDVVAFVPEEL